MSGINRVCYPTAGAEVIVKPDGTIRVIGAMTEAQEKYSSLFHIPNVTHVTSASTVEECFDLMNDNATDIIAVRRPAPVDGNHVYHVPIQVDLYVNQIVSGYNYSDYLRKVENTEDSATALLRNFTVYDSSAIALTLVFLLSILLISQVSRYLAPHHVESTGFASKFRRKCKKRGHHSTTITYRVIRFSFFSSFFLLSSPFLAKFSTNQVVTSPPDIISTYLEVIERKAKVLISKELVDEYLLRPSEQSIKYDNIQAKMYQYLKNNSIAFTIPDSLDKMSQFDATARPVHTGAAVMFAANYIAEAFSSCFCSWSNESTLVQTFTHTDESSTGMLTGFPFRRNFSSLVTVRRLRRLFEGDMFHAVGKTTIMYMGFEVKRLSTSASHRLEQRILCSDDDVARAQKSTHAPTLRSFAPLFLIYLSITCTVVIIRIASLFTVGHRRHEPKLRNTRQYNRYDHSYFVRISLAMHSSTAEYD